MKCVVFSLSQTGNSWRTSLPRILRSLPKCVNY